MPTLNWIGKDAVVRHHEAVPFHLLQEVPALSCGDDSGHLIVEGDNLLALKALLPHYAGQVKCIYIDPPYNTGNEGWVYNDNVNSAQMKQWLGKVVGKEAEDLSRHDKWLCMMYPRLALLKKFLHKDGAIFISIDDNEVASLRFLMDEIFGAQNFVATVLWQKVYSPKNSARHLSEDHDYVLIYASKAETWKPNLLPRTDEQNAAYKNPDNDSRGVWKTSDLSARNYYSGGTYAVTSPSGRTISAPPKGRYWTISRERFEGLDRDNRIWWGKDGNSIPQTKRFLHDVKDGRVPQTLWFYNEVGHTQEAKKELLELVDFETSDDVFITPKPTRLIQRILQIASDKNSLILDSFAGSGTTAHAVMKQNAEDGGTRRAILVEMDPKIAREITAQRVRRVVNGYRNRKGEDLPGLGGGFRYCTLAQPLFDARGQISASVRFADLAKHVYFVETGVPLPSPLPSPASGRGGKGTPLLGVHHGRAVYLLYNGILGDRSTGGGNTLTSPLLAELPAHDGPKVIYGARCLIGLEKLRRLGIVFKQLPYQLKVER